MAENTFERVQKVVCEELSVSPEQVTLEASFTDDLNADSLAVVELVMRLEEEFSIEIPDEDVEGLKTVGDAVNYVDAHS
jgi:acyl carrier protein